MVLEFQQEGTPTGAAISARLRSSRLAARVSACVLALMLSVAVGSVFGRPINLPSGTALGFLLAALLERVWFERLLVLAVINDKSITVVRRVGTQVKSEQVIPRVRDGKFMISGRPAFLSANFGDSRDLLFGKHVIKLPFGFSSPRRAAELRDAWNQLVERQWAASA